MREKRVASVTADSAPKPPTGEGGGGSGESTPDLSSETPLPRSVPGYGNVYSALRILKLRGLARTPNPRLDDEVIRLAKKELLRGIMY